MAYSSGYCMSRSVRNSGLANFRNPHQTEPTRILLRWQQFEKAFPRGDCFYLGNNCRWIFCVNSFRKYLPLKKKLNYDNLPGLIHLFTLENFIDFRNKPTEPTTFKSINMRSNGLVRQLCTCRHFRRVNKGLQVQHFFFALLYGSVNVYFSTSVVQVQAIIYLLSSSAVFWKIISNQFRSILHQLYITFIALMILSNEFSFCAIRFKLNKLRKF